MVNTQLILAVRKGSLEEVKALLASKKHRAKINFQNDAGNTALHIAVMNDKLLIAYTLIVFEAEINIENKEGKTAYSIINEKAKILPPYRDFMRLMRDRSKIIMPDAYLLIGHGNEDITPLEKRWKVPKGVVIVYEKECGEDLLSTTAYRKLNTFLNAARTDLLNPILNKEILEKDFNVAPIKIYVEGMYLPNIFIEFLNVHHMDEGDFKHVHLPYNKDVYYLLKGGVYKFPIKQDDIRPSRAVRYDDKEVDPMGNAIWQGLLGDNYVSVDTEKNDLTTLKDAVRDSFRGAILPKMEEVEGALDTITTKEEMVTLLGMEETPPITKLYPINDIISQFKDGGIFYISSCRSPSCPVNEATIAKEAAASQAHHMNYESVMGQLEMMGHINNAPGEEETYDSFIIKKLEQLEAELPHRNRERANHLSGTKRRAVRATNNVSRTANNHVNVVKKTRINETMRLNKMLASRKAEHAKTRKQRISAALSGFKTRKPGKLNSRWSRK